MEPGTYLKEGTCEEYSDLMKREALRSNTVWFESPHKYRYSVMVCPSKKVTAALIFHGGNMIGAGTAVRNPRDKFYRDAGVRLAITRALHSILLHTRNGNGKKIR